MNKDSLAIPAKVWKFVVDRDGEYCQNKECKNPYGRYANITVHHIIPRSQGGSGENPCNLITLCWHCHDKVEEWKHKKGHEYLCVTRVENLVHIEQVEFYDHEYSVNFIKCSHDL